MSEWELSKENIQPLNRGRKTEILQQSLAEQPPDYYLQKRQFFEQQLRTYEGDDPLSIWCDYIVWVEQTCPKGGKEGNLSKIIQQCLLNLKSEVKYQNEERFIDIWLKFAKMTTKPSEVYANMHSRNIGCKAARFFSAWAWEIEQIGNLKKADQIITEGINRGAQPMDLLKFEQKQLEMRMMKQLANGSAQVVQEQDHRSAFTILKPQDNNKAPVIRTNSSLLPSNKENLTLGFKQPQPRSSSNNASSGTRFKIFSASDDTLSTKDSSSAYVLNKENTKENDKLPGKWNKARVPQSAGIPQPKKPEFEVHSDPMQPSSSTRKHMPHSDRVLMSRKPAEDPPVALFEPPNPMMRPMYDKQKVYGGGEEYSFEEIRGAIWWKKFEEERKRQEEEKEKQDIKTQLQLLQQKLEYLETYTLKPSNNACCHEASRTPQHPKDIKPPDSNISAKKILTDASQCGSMTSEVVPYAVEKETINSNDSVFDSNDLPENIPSKCEGTLVTSAFDFYHDPTEIVRPTPSKCSVMPFAIYQDNGSNMQQQDENCPPPGFVQTQEKREIVGILLPSKNVSFVPLEEQQDEESDEEVLAEPLETEEHTMFPPANTEMFTLATHFTSTPFVHPPTKVPIRPQVDVVQQTEKVIDNHSTMNQRSWGLSTIIETSREGSTKSSSSSAASVGRVKSFMTSEKSVVKNDPIPTTTYCTNINPFDIDFTTNCLKALSVPVTSRMNFHYRQMSCSDIKPGVTLTLSDTSYAIGQQFADGAYAKLFLATALNSNLNLDETLPNTDVAIKVCKDANEWEFYISVELHERLAEEKSTPNILESVVKTHSAIALDNGIALITNYCSYGSLLQIINAYKSNGNTMPEVLVLYFTLELLQIITHIHNCGIIHGDVKPDNFVVNKLPGDNAIDEIVTKTTCLQIIDFGRAIDLTLFKQGITFDTVVTTDSFQCPEMVEKQPWVHQPDWYGILGTIHVMLFGEYMKVQKNKDGFYKPVMKFKRWQADIWEHLFKSFLNMQSCYDVPSIEPFVDSIMSKLKEQSKQFLWESRKMSRIVRYNVS